MADKVINNIKLPNGEIYSVGGAGRFGIKGDYSTHYGIEYCQHGLIENPVGTTDIVVKGGMMLCLPGAETKTTIGSDITYSVSSLTDVTVFYAEGNILEAGEVHYSVNEPADNGIENYIAWWNPDVGKWQFKSNDTGNVWREAVATPIADIRIEEGNIVRIDYIGYRVLNDDIYGLKSETANVDLSNLTEEGINFIIKNSAGANLFDTKLVDHILTFEESEGWALQGTYVYKEAVAGSRYGYPDFYNKCLEEYENSTPYFEAWTQPIATGAITAIDGGEMVITASGDHYNSIKTPLNGDYTSVNSPNYWKASPSATSAWWQVKFPYKIKVTGLTFYNGSANDFVTKGRFYTSIEMTTPIGDEFSPEASNLAKYEIQNIPNEGIITDTIYFHQIDGVNGGGISEITITAEKVTGMKINPNGHLFYDISEKDQIDELFATTGIAWYYGIDKANERIFLPRTKWFIQPTGEITEVNTVNEAGLPNITAWVSGPSGVRATGAFSVNPLVPLAGGSSSAIREGDLFFDASKSNPIYGNSTTVQPPSINQLLYICVGNTNVEPAVTDVVDVTTTENDTMPLFTGMYFDFTPNNVSWLKAGEQANSGGIYKFTYNELVNILNGETKYGDLKVINVADMVTGVDYSDYWKVNQEDMTFITPTAISNKALSGGVMGNGMTLGLTDGSANGGIVFPSGSSVGLVPRGDIYGQPTGTTTSSTSSQFTLNKSIGITTDPTKSGIIAEQSTSQLYFKVANAVQNLELLDAGEVLESLADKISRQDCKAYVTEIYQNGTSWYRVYSDGWCEQGGIVTTTGDTIYFLKTFIDTNYFVSALCDNSSAGGVYHYAFYSDKTTTSIKLPSAYGGSWQSGAVCWEVKGYIA